MPNSVFNNGKSQVNFNELNNISGDYAFANLIKMSGLQFQGSNTTITPDVLNSNGWVTSFPSGVTNIAYSFTQPSQNERPGNYDLSWTGTGGASFTISGGATVVSGSLTPSGSIGHCVVSFPTATAQTNFLKFGAPVANVQFCHVDDLPALALNPNAFSPQFLSVLKALNFGVLRFLNWINGNNGTSTTWASRKPISYFSFADKERRAADYGGVATNSGSDYTVAASANWAGIADKAVISAFLLNAAPTAKTAVFTNGSSSIIATAHGLSTGNQVWLQTSGAIPTNFVAFGSNSFPASYTTYFVTFIDADTVTLSATSGGSAIVAGSAGSGTQTMNPYLTLKVGASAAAPLWSRWSSPYPQQFQAYPGANALLWCVYDAALGAFLAFSSGNDNGVAPEVCLQLCQQLGAHPWFVTPFLACDPATDYVPSLCSLIQTSYQNGTAPWMVPRIETPNECWNGASTFDTKYALAKSAAYGWGTSTSYDDWIGKAGSILGQACANVFGFGNKGTKYHSIIGVQTTTGTDQNFGTGASKIRFNSNQFMTNDPNSVQSPYTRTPAFVWCSHLCAANYIVPSDNSELGVVSKGYAYTVTNAGNPTAQAQNVADYVDTLGGSALHFNSAAVLGFFTNWVAFGQGVTQGQTHWTYNATNYTFGVTCYEGGPSPDIIGPPKVPTTASPITGAAVTSGTTVDLTLATTSVQGNGARAGNPAISGMYLNIASVAGMTQLNGNTYLVSNVSGNTVTIIVPSTAGFGAYTSGGSASYSQDAGATIASDAWLNNIRLAIKQCVTSTGQPGTGLGGWLTANYSALTGIGVVFPSCFQLSAPPPVPGGDIWSILDDIYQPFATSAQALAIQTYNN